MAEYVVDSRGYFFCMVQKQVQAKSSVSAAMDDKAMPQYMFKNQRGTGYFFRRGVPDDVKPTIGKTEIKRTLGGDFGAPVGAVGNSLLRPMSNSQSRVFGLLKNDSWVALLGAICKELASDPLALALYAQFESNEMVYPTRPETLKTDGPGWSSVDV